MKNIIKLLLVGLLICSCSEDKIMQFEETTPMIYFQQNAGTTLNNNGLVTQRRYRDSMIYNFAGANDLVISSNINMPFLLLGLPKDYDRPVNFKLNETLTTGVEGVDFEIDYQNGKLSAGKMSGNIIVKLIRTQKLKKQTLRVAFDLIPNDHFQLALEKYNNTNTWQSANTLISGHTFKIIFSESVAKPSYWNSYGAEFFGTWTPEKYEIVNNTMGWTISNWGNAGQASSPIGYGTLGYAAFKTQIYLQAEADAGRPQKETDGTFMQLGNNYTVDYSAYEK